MTQDDSIETLRNQWKDMFKISLPKAASSKSTAQKHWPVVLDHCFARIILDNVVGIDEAWTKKIKSPAYKWMSREQLQASTNLGNEILRGEVDLEELNDHSLTVRGKSRRPALKKRKLEEDADNVGEEEKNARPKKKIASAPEAGEEDTQADLSPFHDLLTEISQSSKTPFQKRVLSLLCQIPRGSFTTYAAISANLRTSPRAVGGAVKNNEWAPKVPCHRVIAVNGEIGGFFGSWGRNGEAGKNDEKKRKLLRDEGVKFDEKGRAIGTAWSEFV